MHALCFFLELLINFKVYYIISTITTSLLDNGFWIVIVGLIQQTHQVYKVCSLYTFRFQIILELVKGNLLLLYYHYKNNYVPIFWLPEHNVKLLSLFVAYALLDQTD